MKTTHCKVQNSKYFLYLNIAIEIIHHLMEKANSKVLISFMLYMQQIYTIFKLQIQNNFLHHKMFMHDRRILKKTIKASVTLISHVITCTDRKSSQSVPTPNCLGQSVPYILVNPSLKFGQTAPWYNYMYIGNVYQPLSFG